VVICLERGAVDLHMAQLMPLPLTVSCFSKSRLVLPIWYRLTHVVLEKRPLNGCNGCSAIITWSAQYAVSIIKQSSVRPSVCLSRRVTAVAVVGGFAAEVGKGQQISTNSCCCRTTCGPRTFWSDCQEVQHTCYYYGTVNKSTGLQSQASVSALVEPRERVT